MNLFYMDHGYLLALTQFFAVQKHGISNMIVMQDSVHQLYLKCTNRLVGTKLTKSPVSVAFFQSHKQIIRDAKRRVL